MIISLHDVNKTYPGIVPLHVLKDINLEIERGELVSVMGASGSGKSTLLNILGILDSYDSGDYVLDGLEIRNLSENRAAEIRNRKIGFVFQSFNLINYKNALENVALPLFYQGIGRRKRNALAMEQLERMGLADRAHHLPGELHSPRPGDPSRHHSCRRAYRRTRQPHLKGSDGGLPPAQRRRHDRGHCHPRPRCRSRHKQNNPYRRRRNRERQCLTSYAK